AVAVASAIDSASRRPGRHGGGHLVLQRNPLQTLLGAKSSCTWCRCCSARAAARSSTSADWPLVRANQADRGSRCKSPVLPPGKAAGAPAESCHLYDLGMASLVMAFALSSPDSMPDAGSCQIAIAVFMRRKPSLP